MEARVKKNARYPTYQLFSGHEYVKSEWRKVPPDFEEQALEETELIETRGQAEEAPAEELPKALHAFDPDVLEQEADSTEHKRRGRRHKKEETEAEG